MATLAEDVLTRPTQVPAYITEAEYLAMCNAGVFGDDHVELNRGVLERMAPSGGGHADWWVAVIVRLHAAYAGTSHRLLADVRVRLAPGLIRAPDVAVFRPGPLLEIMDVDQALLAVEIADRTRREDLGVKAIDYAAAGLPAYWVVDVRDRVTYIHAGPGSDGYAQRTPVPFDRPLAPPEAHGTVTLD